MMQVNTQGILQQLQAQYPNQFKQLQEMRRNSTPEMLLKNTLGKQSIEQRRKLYEFAKRFGYSDNQINQIESLLSNQGINT